MKNMKMLGIMFAVCTMLIAVSLAADRTKDRDATPRPATVSSATQTVKTGPTQSVTAETKEPSTTAAAVDTVKQSLPPNSPQAPAAGEQINWQVIGGGGGRTASANYKVDMTIGQTAVGVVASASFKLRQGFWQQFPTGCCAALTGNIDCDPDDGVDISDLSALIDNLYISLAPLCCQKEANVDGSLDGNIDISDLSALIDYLYINFTPPAACM